MSDVAEANNPEPERRDDAGAESAPAAEPDPATGGESEPAGDAEPEPAGETAPRAATHPLLRLVPALDSLRQYSAHAFRSDLVAGLTVAAVAVPQAMAYASIFGVPVEYGLYTAIVMTAVGALFDSSKQLINGPTNAISVALLSALAIPSIATQSDKIAAAVLLALLVGIIQTGITLFRLGDLSRYISHAVIVGFTLGAGVLLVLDQFTKLLGLNPPDEHAEHFLVRFWQTLRHGEVHGWTLALGLGTVALVLVTRLLNWRFKLRLPEFLLAVIAAAALVWAMGLDQPTVGVKVVGDIPRKLPSFELPSLGFSGGDWRLLRDLSYSALAIALLGLLEAIAMAKSIAAHTGQKLDINQQCLSEGLANLAGGFFQCFPGSGSLTRSAINHQAGAATQWSGVISAAAVAATVLLVAPLARYIPRAALAGILILSAWRMVDRHQLLYHLRATRFDAGIVIATAFSAVAVSVEFCILIGTFLSFIFYVPRAARVHLSELTLAPERVIRERLKTDPPCSRILIFNLEGEMFFGSAPDLEAALGRIEQRAVPDVRVLVLRLKRARNPDAVCFALLDEFLRRMEARGVRVLLCGVRHDVSKVLHNLGIEQRLGPNRVFREVTAGTFSTLDAVRHAYELLGDDLCENCPRRQGKPGRDEGWYYMI
jgi:SulP family sulfate permease